MKAIYFFILSVILIVTGVLSMRINRQKALELKNQLLEMDQNGEDINTPLATLKTFVFNHMNSSVSFQLTGSYNRAVANASDNSHTNVNGELYKQAQDSCDKKALNSVDEAKCVQEYLDAHIRPAENPQPSKLPEIQAYNYAYASPFWTFDLAGWSFLGAVIATLVAIILYSIKVTRVSKNL